MGLAPPTLRLWRDKAVAAGTLILPPTAPPPVPEKQDFAVIWAAKESMVLDLIEAKAPEASFRDLSIFAGIAADKHLDYSQGRKGATVNVDASTTINADALIAAAIRLG